jgi:hypothetical protein
VNDNVPAPAERLIAALDPIDEIDLGQAVVIAHDSLTGEAATVLAELIHKRVRRAVADAYDRGFNEGREEAK